MTTDKPFKYNTKITTFLESSILSIAGQLLPLAVLPALTRLYTPDEFGVFAMFFAAASVLGGVAALRMEQGIVLEAGPELAHATAATSIGTAAGLALTVAATGYLIGIMLLPVGTIWANLPFWGGIALAAFAQAAMSVLTLMALRAELAIAPARAKIVQGVALAIVPIGLGLAGAGAAGLVLGQVAGFLFGAAALSVSVGPWWRDARLLTLARCRAAWRRQRAYRLYAAPALLLNTGTKMLPVILLAAAWGDGLAGQVAVAQRLLFAPARLLGQTVSHFYIARAARLARTNPEALAGLFTHTMFRLVLVGSLIFLPIFAIPDDLVAWALGEEWRTFGRVMKLLVPLAWADFILFPIGQTFNLINKHAAGLVFDLVYAALVASVFIGCYLTQVAGYNVILMWSLATCLCYVTSLAGCYTLIINKHPSDN
ncbi:lipopolysaccharide biosynthesis protein [Geminicoccus flavidas]|uniref:lipopolysaccharide biosynthesis protein n=1 Tax=Geminicoccus flavidas TaxID=2506407 RepID=UPI00135AC3B8|nr:oligosaccharide flippase family protein [Geminicoccus flavidas]